MLDVSPLFAAKAAPPGTHSRTIRRGQSVSIFAVCIGPILLAALGACTTVEVDSYRRVPDSSADMAYVREGTDFSRYRRLYPQPLEIYYSEGAGSPTQENLERMRGIFRRVFLAELDGQYEITDKPAPDALGVLASLVDMRGEKLGEGDAVEQYTGQLRSLVAEGQLTFFMELSDSMSGVILARAADRDRSEPELISSPETIRDTADVPWPRVEAAAKRWAAMFREFLDENLGH